MSSEIIGVHNYHSPEHLEMRAKLALKILRVQKALGGMTADGVNSHQGYKYISAQAIKARLSEILPEVGLAILPNEKSLSVEQVGETRSGNAQFAAEVCIEYRIIDTETGWVEACLFSGHDVDTGHKQAAKAKTECHKRWLGQLLNISESDEDPDSSTTTTAAKTDHSKSLEAMAKKYPKFSALPKETKDRYREKGYVWASGDKHASEHDYDPEKIAHALADN